MTAPLSRHLHCAPRPNASFSLVHVFIAYISCVSLVCFSNHFLAMSVKQWLSTDFGTKKTCQEKKNEHFGSTTEYCDRQWTLCERVLIDEVLKHYFGLTFGLFINSFSLTLAGNTFSITLGGKMLKYGTLTISLSLGTYIKRTLFALYYFVLINNA